jgi:predicted XRE-type DNA-binding protein
MKETLTNDEMLEQLRSAIKQAGSQGKFAELVGCTQPFISKILGGEKSIPSYIGEAVGYRKQDQQPIWIKAKPN